MSAIPELWTPEGAAIAVEALLVLAGLAALWRWVASPRARATKAPMRLEAWTAGWSEFLLLLCTIFVGAAFAVGMANAALTKWPVSHDLGVIVASGAMHVGILCGIVAFHLMTRGAGRSDPPGIREAIGSGVVTFLIALPLLLALGNAWEGVLHAAGYPDEHQELVDILERSQSNSVRIGLVSIATLLVPVTEELVFRAGLFRYLRTRISRRLVLVLTAVLFGAAHGDLSSFPSLTVLAIVFSLAYERTGNIGTTIVAHALFNLNAFVLIVAGAGT